MIIDKLFEMGFWLFDLLLSFLEDLPLVPDSFTIKLDLFVDFIQGGLCVVNCFLDLDFIKKAIVVWLAITFTEQAYQLLMWVLRKIPMLGIE